MLGKYENDDWLGKSIKNQAGSNNENQWPVAYHGTHQNNVGGIIIEGFRLDKGKRFSYGHGIYCSPNPAVALGYSHVFSFKVPTTYI